MLQNLKIFINLFQFQKLLLKDQLIDLHFIQQKDITIELLYEYNKNKYKIQVKFKEAEIKVKVNKAFNEIQIIGQKIKQYKQIQERQKLKWAIFSSYTNEKLKIRCKDSDNFEQILEKFNLFNIMYEQIIEQVNISQQHEEQIFEQLQQCDYQQKQEQNDLNQINFRIPLHKQLETVKSQSIAIRNLQLREKKLIITNIFRVKRSTKQDFTSCKLKCPVPFCNKIYLLAHHLRYHFIICHPFLIDFGIFVNNQGKINYTQKSVNFVLVLARLYPQEMKKIIKRMKLRPSTNL